MDYRTERSVAVVDTIVISERANAAIGWLTVGFVGLAAVESVLTDALLWAGFSLVVVAVASLPAVTRRDWSAVVPWPLSSVAAVAVVARAAGRYGETAGYLAIATFALLVVVELDTFTSVDLGRRFAVGFGVLTTMAVESLWIVAQFYSDRWLGTEFLSSQRELQEDIVIVTVVGFAVGGLFYWLFDRFEFVGTADRPSHRTRSR